MAGVMLGETGVPEGIRTPDLRFRKPLLYPAELPGRTGPARAAPERASHYSPKARMRSRAIWVAGALLSGSAAADTCPPPLEMAGEAVRVTDRLEIALADGRLLRQPGLAPFSGPAARSGAQRARDAVARRLDEEPLEAPARLPAEDRWGRISAPLFFAGENLGVWLAARGLVRVQPASDEACAGSMLAAEAKARQAKLGLWADSYYSVLPAADPAAIMAHAGDFVLVEGRIFRLGQTSARFYLDFGPARGLDLSVTISKSLAKSFAAAGMAVEGLPGRRVRVRGVVENRPGPVIELRDPAAMEAVGR